MYLHGQPFALRAGVLPFQLSNSPYTVCNVVGYPVVQEMGCSQLLVFWVVRSIGKVAVGVGRFLHSCVFGRRYCCQIEEQEHQGKV